MIAVPYGWRIQRRAGDRVAHRALQLGDVRAVEVGDILGEADPDNDDAGMWLTFPPGFAPVFQFSQIVRTVRPTGSSRTHQAYRSKRISSRCPSP